MAIPNYSFYGWNTNYVYSKWDVIYGASAGDTRYFYSTTDNNLSANPNDVSVFLPTSATRLNNVTRISFPQSYPYTPIQFKQGSIVAISDIVPDSTLNYTGTVLAAGSGYLDYLNPGLNTTNSITGGYVTAPIHMNWTTGFYWLPSWTTDVTHNMAVIEAKMGEGYSQRQNPSINSNSLTWNLAFEERTDKETMALLNFLEVAGGVTPFYINFPVGNLYNMPNLKYVNQSQKHQLTSYGLNTVSVVAAQVFDIG